MPDKVDRLIAIQKQMRQVRIDSHQDPEQAHVKADDLLIQTIQVLTSGTTHRLVVGEILSEYGHPDFDKCYS